MGVPQWEQQANLWRSDLGISKTRAMWDALDQEPVGLTLTPRIQTSLNLVVAEKTKSVKIKCRKNATRALKNTVVDVSQNPVRKSFTKDSGNIGTLCTSTQLFHIGRGARILPPEMLWLQGHNPKRTVIPGTSHLTSCSIWLVRACLTHVWAFVFGLCISPKAFQILTLSERGPLSFCT